MKSNEFFEHNEERADHEAGDRLKQFEQLSAYFDGEATPEECRQIQQLLDADPEIKRQYLQLHQLRQGLQTMPVPAGESPQRLGQQVFSRFHRSRAKVVSIWGSGAIAALFIAGVTSQMPSMNNKQTEVANLPVETNTQPIVTPNHASGSEPLIVAINRPMLQIPKLATAEPIDAP